MLASLPTTAQTLLLAPFLSDEELLTCSWFYYGADEDLSKFAFVLAGPRTLTCATGKRTTLPGRSQEIGQWSLTCRRAEVVRRIGV